MSAKGIKRHQHEENNIVNLIKLISFEIITLEKKLISQIKGFNAYFQMIPHTNTIRLLLK